MIDAYRQADVTVHTLPAEAGLPYQLFARDSSVMTPWGAVILQTQKPYRRGEYAACIQFYLDAEIPIYDLITAGNIEGGDFMVLKPGVAKMQAAQINTARAMSARIAPGSASRMTIARAPW